MDRSSVAVITDIHGNLPALEAALARIEELGIDQVYCGGDLVGYGPWPNEVCDLIRERDIPTIYGNYDYAIGRDEEDCMCAYPKQHERELGQLSVNWTLEHTSRASKDFMREAALRPALPARRQASTARSRLPAQGQRVPLRGQAGEDLRADRRGADCDVMVFGHTHKPWIHEYGGILFVNCGSVGKPKDGDVRGGFAILEAKRRGGGPNRAIRVRRRVSRRARSPAGLPRSAPRSSGRGLSRHGRIARPSPDGCSPSSSARPSSRPSVIGSGIAAASSSARGHRPAAVRERGCDRGWPVHDHPDVRAGLRRALQPGRLAGRREFGGLRWRDAVAYIPAQVIGCIAGAVVANGMFALTAISISDKHRASEARLLAEVVATLGLLLVIFSLARTRRGSIAPAAVGAYIGAAYFFTSSTSFANPAISVGRMFSDTFAGIAPARYRALSIAQLVGGARRDRGDPRALSGHHA